MLDNRFEILLNCSLTVCQSLGKAVCALSCVGSISSPFHRRRNKVTKGQLPLSHSCNSTGLELWLKSSSKHFITPKEKPVPIKLTPHSPLPPPRPGNYQSAFCWWQRPWARTLGYAFCLHLPPACTLEERGLSWDHH